MAIADQEFNGTGWNLGASGIGLGADGEIAQAGGDEKIRQSILIILSTAPGERIGRPDFGCGIHEFVFSPLSPLTLGRIVRSVSMALERWEPRISVLQVHADPHPVRANTILVQIHYEVRSDNRRFNLLYPFYLSP